MIVTDRFVYIHLHKSGGTFINECLLRFVPGARQLGYHLPRRLIPAALSALPVLGFVRNPWSYYVSWHSFQTSLPHGNVLFQCMSENGTLDFKHTVHNLLDLGTENSKLDLLLPLLPKTYTQQGLNLPRFALEPIRGVKIGFYAHLYHYMYGGPGSGPLYVGRMETLRDDFLKFLAQVEVPVSDDLRRFVITQSARNKSAHANYARYYDDELRELVAARDASVIKAFGYRFGD